MPLRYRSRRGGYKATAGRVRKVKYSRGQNYPTYTRTRKVELLHVFPSNQGSAGIFAASDSSPVTLGTSGSNGVVLNQVSRGSGINNRLGTRIFMRDLLLNWEASMGNNGLTVPVSHQHFKLFVVYDKRPRTGTSSTPSLTDIYENTQFTAFREMSSRDRYDVLWEKDIQLTGEAVSPTQFMLCAGSYQRGSVRIPVRRMVSWVYNDTAGDLVAMTLGALYLIAMAGSPFVGAVSPAVVYNWKLTFDDTQ